jgi:pilus assembly protein CpaC
MLNFRIERPDSAAGRPHCGRRSLLSAVAASAIVVGAGEMPLMAQFAPAVRIDTVEDPQPSEQIQPADAQMVQDPALARPLPPQVLAIASEQDEISVIQRRSQLLTTRSNIVRTAIADPSVMDMVQYSPNEISIIGLEVGSTTLTLWFEDSPEPLIYLVRTIPDPGIEERQRIDYGRLEQKLAVIFPNSRVYLIPLSGKIIVKGQARDSKEAADILEIIRGEVINQSGNLIGPQPQPAATAAGLQAQVLNPFDLASTFIVNMLEIPGEFQVQLRVRIAELNRSQLRRAGIDFEYLINNGRHAVAYGLGGTPATMAGVFEDGEISLLVNALASNGTAKILAEPVLTVLSGHTASFLSGGEFAVPTIVGIGGAQGQQTTFRGFGTSLLVTPIVLDKDLVRMTIVPEFSQINSDNSVGDIPGVDTRRTQTTVELREGQTIVIAGLISNQTSTEITRLPFLSELPYVGSRLFSAKRASQDQTELLILVSPELVRPMDADQVPPVPGFEVTHPNDWELCHAAMSEGVPDTGVYQLAPYGTGSSYGINVGYTIYEPSPASPLYSPVPTNPYGYGGAVQYLPSPGQPAAPAQRLYPGSARPASPDTQRPQQPAHPVQTPAQPAGNAQRFMPAVPKLQSPEALPAAPRSGTPPSGVVGTSYGVSYGAPAASRPSVSGFGTR